MLWPKNDLLFFVNFWQNLATKNTRVVRIVKFKPALDILICNVCTVSIVIVDDGWSNSEFSETAQKFPQFQVQENSFNFMSWSIQRMASDLRINIKPYVSLLSGDHFCDCH